MQKNWVAINLFLKPKFLRNKDCNFSWKCYALRTYSDPSSHVISLYMLTDSQHSHMLFIIISYSPEYSYRHCKFNNLGHFQSPTTSLLFCTWPHEWQNHLLLDPNLETRKVSYIWLIFPPAYLTQHNQLISKSWHFLQQYLPNCISYL